MQQATSPYLTHHESLVGTTSYTAAAVGTKKAFGFSDSFSRSVCQYFVLIPLQSLALRARRFPQENVAKQTRVGVSATSTYDLKIE